MKKYKVTFDRIGRNHAVPAAAFEVESTDDLAYQVHEYARGFLISRDYQVTVEESRGCIEGGRFGAFTIEEVEA